jgi:aryl-alcohol dehydrogenase-like predicted oxidoreductase
MGPAEKGLSKEQILTQAEISLKRLQVDTIDLYQSHFDDAEVAPEETLGAYAQLLKQGKVRVIGASNYTAPRLAHFLAASREKGLPRYESLQPHYNLCEREAFEKDLEPLCRDKNLGVIPYFSLAAGFLTGKYRSEADLGKSPRGQGMKKYLNDWGFRILKALDEVAKEMGATPARVALAWLVAKPTVTAPIASATNLEQFKDLVAGVRLELDSPSLKKLDEASAY